MSFFSLVAVMVWEHFHPFGQRTQLYALFARYGNFLERQFNAGRYRYGILAWALGVLPPALAVGVVSMVLADISTILVLAFNIGILYLTLGCSQLMQGAGKVAAALRVNDLESARNAVGDWEGHSVREFDANALARVATEKLFLCAHRQFFGVFFWFAVLGPAGAVLYRLAFILAQKWGVLDHQDYGRFGMFPDAVFQFLDWIPLRLTALSFAIMGNFEDAIRCWQEQASQWAHQTQGIILASAAGALGVRLGEALNLDGQPHFRADLGVGDEADADYLDSAVSLVWRAVALWLGILLLLTITRWAS